MFYCCVYRYRDSTRVLVLSTQVQRSLGEIVIFIVFKSIIALT